MEKTGTFESMWKLLINCNIRWQYTFSRQAKRTSLIQGFVVLFWCRQWIWNKKCNTNYSYKLVTTFKVVPEVVYGSLPTMGEAGEPHRYDLTRRSTPPRAEPLVQYPVSRSFPTKWKLQVLSRMDWGQENSESVVKSPTPNVGEQTLETSISGRDRQPKDVRPQNACALLTSTIWW